MNRFLFCLSLLALTGCVVPPGTVFTYYEPSVYPYDVVDVYYDAYDYPYYGDEIWVYY